MINKKHIVLLGHFAALITVTFWGTSFLSTKVLLVDGGMTPAEVYIYRFAAAWFILLLISGRKLWANSWRDELLLALSGVCSGSLYFVTENYALRLTTTANVSLLGSVSPLFTTFLVALVYRQKLKPGVLIGSLIAFSGVACVIFSSGESLEIRPTGDLLALMASFCWAIYSIAIRPLLPLYSSTFISRKLFFYGVISAVPLLLIQAEPMHLGLLFDIVNPKYLLNFLYLVLMCSITGYLLWNEVMKYLGTVTANNYIYVQPLVTMVAGSLILGEHIYLLGYIGCVLIIGGLVMGDKLPDGIRLRRRL